jgi:hypothetical protein
MSINNNKSSNLFIVGLGPLRLHRLFLWLSNLCLGAFDLVDFLLCIFGCDKLNLHVVGDSDENISISIKRVDVILACK